MSASAVRAAAVVAFCIGFVAAGAAPAGAQVWTVTVNTTSSGQAAGGQAPDAPTSPSATCQSAISSAVIVAWTAAPHATQYTVSDSASENGTFTAIATTDATSTTVTGLTTGAYYFKVSADIGDYWAGPQSSATSARTIVATPLLPLGACT